MRGGGERGTEARSRNHLVAMPLPARGCCDVDWMCESKYGCEPSGDHNTIWRARNWHWLMRYCNLAGKITNGLIDPIDLASTDSDGRQTRTRDRVVRMCATHVHLLRPLRKFVSVPEGKLSMAAEFAVLRNAYLRYHEAKALGQEVECLGGLESKAIPEGVVSQPDRAVWAVTEMPASITGNLPCPQHLIDLQFRNAEDELRHAEYRLARKCMESAVLEDRAAAAQAMMAVEKVSVGTQTDPVDTRPEPPGAM